MSPVEQPPPAATPSPEPEASAATTVSEPVAVSSAEAPSLSPEPVEPPKPPPPPEEPILVDEEGSPLPQTKDQPQTDTAIYQHHVELLFEAIVKDDPEIAKPFFFPLIAYEQVKAIEKPSWDWNHRLWKHFVRDVHEYHAKLGDNPDEAVLEQIVLREPSIRWMKPHSEGNRLGYYRVTRSRIQGRKANGEPLDWELTSMISWRGEWYVVHLHGFR